MLNILYVYISIILVLVFFSKTIYTFSLPKVSVAIPTSGTLTKELESNGIVSFAETADIFSTVDGQIKELYIKTGDFILDGGLIAKCEKQLSNEEDMDAELGFTIQKIKNEIRSIMLEKTGLESEIEALNEKSSTPLIDETLPLELHEIERLISQQEESLHKSQVLYESGTIPKADYDQEIEKLNTLENAKESKQKQIEKQVQDNQQIYGNNEKIRLNLQNQKKIALAKTTLAIKKATIDLQEAELALSKAMNHHVEGGVIKGEQGGIITAVEKQKNSFVSLGERVATVGLYNTSFVTEFLCSKGEGKFIATGDEASLIINGMKGQVKAFVSEIRPEGENLRIKLSFQSGYFKGGEYVSIKLLKQTKSYDVLVPNEAIIKEGFNNYVWVVRSKNGTLGMEHYSVKVKVLIADSDFGYTAISKGMDFIEPVIIGKDKDLVLNGRVNQMD